ncbi:MAG: ATPase [Gallionellales bacterium 35-53-114]|nr:MAG: ATPase [Gallionellales bacterium 35-53-114]OYZ65486.1 MAG: ATPase [Gallionellales bacterium 24-53-125]OZB08394.1 MAG: ATPase [Gallionellales bacterium 39-52-133]HQS58028.1 cation-translocating P-type ATPase [Gallionellaceae bacterium]
MRLDQTGTQSISGLTQTEALLRLKAEGANELPSAGQRQLWHIALEVLREPMFMLLISAGAIYLLLGEVNDALMLLGFVMIVMGITISQEYKTERVLEALRDLTSPRARVIREGLAQRIAGREVVRGDILLLAEGDRIPADAVLLECSSFSADESLLTGESVAVRKIAGLPHQYANTVTPLQPGGDDQPYIYSGTLVVQGRGIARVLATGSRSEIGKIGKTLHDTKTQATPLQQEISWLVRWLALIGTSICLVLILIYGFTRSDWLNGLLAGITLAMTLLPEEYPVVLTVFLAMGAWRISRHQILTRSMPAVEALGSTTVLCVDKTGTLTLNRMAVQQLNVGREIYKVETDNPELPETFHQLMEFAVLSSEADPFDPMEKAIHELTNHFLAHTEHIHRDWQHKHDYAISPDQLALSHVWKARDRDEYVVASKGAPEAIADLCHLDAAQLAALDQQINALAAQGMRVLGVARATYQGREWPEIQHDFEFKFIGLIGLADPVRPTVSAALRECDTAGIRVVMITGDYPATASAIARQIGLNTGTGGIITGPELIRMDDATLRERACHSNIFARMVPQQKLQLVNALKANGEVVAMTGDGVNDAPALKAAHIGIAMGGRGTDVAREAAALVLLDDDFSSIVRAIRMGRGIFDNMRKAMAYIFAVHIPIIGLSLIPILLGWPVIFAPVHIVFLEMIINPACSIAFEAEPAEKDIMQRPPRKPQEHLFGKNILLISLAQGMVVLLASLAVLLYAMHNGVAAETARALTFTTIVIGNLGLILVNRSWQHTILATLRSRNRAIWWVIGGAFSFLLLSLTLPFMREVFHFAPVTLSQFALCVATGIASVLWFEWYKIIQRK